MTKKTFKLGTRGSKLALWQSRYVSAQIRAQHPHIEIEELVIKTTGDKFLDSNLFELGGKGAFLKEIEEALLDCRVDFAVHSLKDVPAFLPEGLGLVAFLPREEASDVFLSFGENHFGQLKKGSVIGTSSLRRLIQLRQIRPDLQYKDLRGNIDTRLLKLQRGEYDGIVLAYAGLKRLGLQCPMMETLPTISAVGQGAIVVEARLDDPTTRNLVRTLNDFSTAEATMAERVFMSVLGADCRVPVGCHVKLKEEKAVYRCFVAHPLGNPFVKKEGEVDRGQLIKTLAGLADEMLKLGATEWMGKK
ncbi:MAG TPA: hydroxymethylbilane synthase [Deltaproteobacteria bacterium]|nr:MAG: hydroxymethylbilane synthase [Deltaproteobacteria bacterium GWA2_45_12]HBF12874.1 hydroxymethylbilane synthase [Deltaproteobacteria bacterium]